MSPEHPGTPCRYIVLSNRALQSSLKYKAVDKEDQSASKHTG